VSEYGAELLLFSSSISFLRAQNSKPKFKSEQFGFYDDQLVRKLHKRNVACHKNCCSFFKKNANKT
jgi:hypothetical protein